MKAPREYAKCPHCGRTEIVRDGKFAEHPGRGWSYRVAGPPCPGSGKCLNAEDLFGRLDKMRYIA